MEPQFRFCTSADGTRIAWASYGSGPLLLYPRVFWLSMEAGLSNPGTRAYFDGLASHNTLILFDRRGVGASAREVTDLSPVAEARDLEAVVEAAGSGTFSVITDTDALASAALYVAAHGDRVESFVLWAAAIHADQQFVRLIRADWSYARRMWASAAYPDGPVSTQREFSGWLKESISAEMAARRFETANAVDLAELLPGVTMRSLVLAREEPASERAIVMALARLLPNSETRFVPGNSPSPGLDSEPLVAAIRRFLGTPTGGAPDVHGGTATILFTDMVGHTEMMQRLGDAKGRDVLREHERITRDLLKQHGGAEVKTMGDGFMASFGSVRQAMECAIALQRAFAEHSDKEGEPLHVRVGLNAGEPIEEDGDLFGSTVILASRIAAKAGAGEILVPETVRGLLSGKNFLFSDRGEFVPKGFDDAVRLYEVRWQL